MKKTMKLLWSYYITKTEKWLSQKASEGYILKDVNTLSRIFTFEKSESKEVTYKICYDKSKNTNLSKSLENDGWKCAVRQNNWKFFINEKSSEDIKLSPSKQNLLKRIKIIKSILIPIIILYSIIFLPIFLIFGSMEMVLGGFGSINFDMNGMPFIFYLFTSVFQNSMFIAYVFAVYSAFRFNSLAKEIKENENIIKVETDDEELSSSQKKQLIKKTRPNWMYKPDITSNWLSDMESQGYNLVKVNKAGNNFYFKKGEPKKVKYIVDYQSNIDETYYDIHKEGGWKLRFNDGYTYLNYNLWSMEYENFVPEIYTDYEDVLANAKTMLIGHTISFIPTILIGILIVVSNLIDINGNRSLIQALVFTILSIQYSRFYLNIVGYYKRMKKKAC